MYWECEGRRPNEGMRRGDEYIESMRRGDDSIGSLRRWGRLRGTGVLRRRIGAG